MNTSGPSLKHFILKQRVLDLYRYAIRASQSLPEPARHETVMWIRSEFERNKHISDTAVIEDKLTSGRRELRQILAFASLIKPVSDP